MKRFVLSISIICIALAGYAVTAVPWPVTVPQPDSTVLSIRIFGDEYSHHYTTIDGYSIEPQPDGSFTYALPHASTSVRTLAHNPDSRSASEILMLRTVAQPATASAQLSSARQTHIRANTQNHRQTRFDYTHFRGLVVLVNYNNRRFMVDDPVSFYDAMLNQPDYTGYGDVGDSIQNLYNQFTGSVRDYFYDNSNHLFDPHFDIVGPIDLERPIDYPRGTSNAPEMFAEALQLIDDEVDFSQYDTDGDGLIDMVYFIVPGPGVNSGAPSAYLWPHKSSMGYINLVLDGVKPDTYACSTEMIKEGSNEILDGIGTICHEFSHVLGLPDLYDRDYTQNGQSIHPDKWEVMAAGNYLNRSRTPAGYSLYDKHSLGFAQLQIIEHTGDFSLLPLETSHHGLMLTSPNDREFFLLENRQPIKWDTYLPGHGMIVARVDSVDENAWLDKEINVDPSHNHYQLLRADAAMATTTAMSHDSDPFPGTHGIASLTNFTTPNLLTWNDLYNTFALDDITERAGNITFKVIDGAAPFMLIEDFETIAVTDDKNLKDVEGTFCHWDFTKCRVESPEDATLCHGQQALALFKGAEAVTDPIDYAVSRVTFTVSNSNSLVGTVMLEYMLENETEWHIATELNSHATAVAVSKGSTDFLYDLRLVHPVCLRISNTSGSSTKACYLDDLTLYCTSHLSQNMQVGDINGDGAVDVADVNQIINIILGKASDTGPLADIDANGTVDVADVNQVINIILSKN